MITIPKEMKPTLNILISYYRRLYAKDNTRFTSKNFILDKDGYKFCDNSTLSKIENNRICSLDSTYYAFIDNLNMVFHPNSKTNTLIKQVNKTILKHAEYNYSKKITKLIEDVRNLISDFNDSIIYHEYLEVYEILYLYYSDVSFNKDLIDKYIELYDIIDENIKPVFLSIAYHYYSRINIDDVVSLNIIERTTTLFTKTIIRDNLMNIYYMRSNQPLNIKKQALKNIAYCEENNNKIYLVKAYNLMAFLYSSTNPEKALMYMELFVENFDHENDFKENFDMTIRNIAHIYYFDKNYNKVVDIYNKYLYENIHFLEVFFMFLIISIKNTTTNLQEIQKIIQIVKDHSSNHSNFHKALINFFYSIYFDRPFKEISKCIDILSKYNNQFMDQEVIKEIILDEITDTCNKHKAYSTYKKALKHFH